jgi:hypothetical protein
MKGEGSAKYLLILVVSAVLLILVLAVVLVAITGIALLGQFTTFKKPARIQQSINYWSRAEPISILQAKLASGTEQSQLLIKNRQMDTLFIKKIEVKTPDGNTIIVYNPTSPTRVGAGEEKVIDLIQSKVNSSICTTPGEVYDLVVTITYKSGDVDNMKQVGQKNLYGECV